MAMEARRVASSTLLSSSIYIVATNLRREHRSIGLMNRYCHLITTNLNWGFSNKQVDQQSTASLKHQVALFYFSSLKDSTAYTTQSVNVA